MPKAATSTKAKIESPPGTFDAKLPTPPDAPPADDLFSNSDETFGFVSIDDVLVHINACFYGPEGSGKTTAAARMANIPGATRVLVINAEGGLKKPPLVKRGVDTSKIVVWPDPTRGEVLTHAALNRLYIKVKSDLMADPNSWTGVIFDSGTEITDALLNRVQEKRVAAIKAKGAEVDEHFVDISDYGTMAKMFRDLLSKFRDLPCHFVVTALERRDVDKDNGKPMYGPAVIASLQSALGGRVDYVLKFKQADEDGPYRALTKQNGKYRAKDRFDVLPKVLAEPWFDRILQYQTGEIDLDSDPFATTIQPGADANTKVEDDADADADDSIESADE